MVKKIIAVFKTHFDIGFTHLFPELMSYYTGEMLDKVIDTCESTQKFGKAQEYKWTMSAWPLAEVLMGAPPQKRKKAEELVKRGQLLAHSLPYTSHTEHLGLEELLRNFLYSKEICDKYNVPYPISAKMTDIPQHTFILPSVLADAGVKFLHLGCNSSCRPADVPWLFWWEGQDGGRVLTYYSKGGYGTPFIPPDDYPFSTHLAMLQTNDNLGPQGQSIIEDLRRYAAEYDKNVEFTVGTMDDFYNEIIKEDLSGLPVIKQDLSDTWIHGVGSYPYEVAKLRRNRERLNSLEKAATLMDINVGSDVKNAYYYSELFGEHTWGLNTIVFLGYGRWYEKQAFKESLNRESHKLMEASWDEQRDRVKNTISATDNLEAKLKKAVNGEYIFNSNSEEFSGEFEKDGKFYSAVIPPLNAVTGGLKEYVPAVIEDSFSFVSENERYILSVNKFTGNIISFYDKTLNKDWATGQTLNYQYDVCNLEDVTEYLRDYAYRFFDWYVTGCGRQSYPDKFEHYRSFAKTVSVNCDNGAIIVESIPEKSFGIEKYGDCHKIITRLTLLSNRLDVKVKLVAKETTPYIEGLHYNFGLNLKNPKYRINKLGSIVDPEKDICTHTNHAMYCLENYITALDKDCACSIVSKDTSLLSIGEEMIYKVKNFYEPREDCNIMFNLMNNMYGTNFPQWMGGRDYDYEFSVFSHKPEDRDIVRQINNTVIPPLVITGEHGNRPLSTLNGQLEITGAKLVTVFKDNGDTYMRIQNQTLENTIADISGKLITHAVTAVDLYYRKTAAYEKQNGKISIPLKPAQILTIKL